MKPIMIYSEAKDNKVILTKEQFEQYILDAYNAGFEDGKNSINPITYIPDYYKAPNLKPPYEVTCRSESEPKAPEMEYRGSF